MRYLLDTCAISELARPRPNQGVVMWAQGTSEHLMAMSVLTIGELAKGIAKLPSSPRRVQLQQWVTNDLVVRFEGRLLPISLEVSTKWGDLLGEAAMRGVTLPVIDGLIAATASVYDLTVVTRNIRDMERCGARVLDPWD